MTSKAEHFANAVDSFPDRPRLLLSNGVHFEVNDKGGLTISRILDPETVKNWDVASPSSILTVDCDPEQAATISNWIRQVFESSERTA